MHRAASRRIGRVLAAIGLASMSFGWLAATDDTPVGAAPNDLVVADVAGGVTPTQLASQLVGGGVQVSNVVYTGDAISAGTFTGGADVGFPSGIVLSSGRVKANGTSCTNGRGVEGPNTCTNNTTNTTGGSDADLANLTTGSTLDAAILEFDFVPAFSTVSFDYVFGSEEYNEYADSSFNDVFGFFVNGTNCATIDTPDGTKPVAIHTINGGEPFGSSNADNAHLYRNNSTNDPGPATLNTELDGLTVVLHCNANVTAGQANHMKLAIADVSDSILDSAVFLGAATLVSGVQINDTLTSTNPAQTGVDLTVASGSTVTDTATLVGAAVTSATGTVTYTVHTSSQCTDVFANAGTKTVGANGVVPASDPVTLTNNGTYFWKSVYSGDPTHNSATSPCTAKATVNDGPTVSSTTSTTSSASTTSTTSSASTTSTTSSASSTSSTSSTVASTTSTTAPPGATTTSTTVAASTSTTRSSGTLGAGSAGGSAGSEGKLAKTGSDLGPAWYLGLLLIGAGLLMMGESYGGEHGLLRTIGRQARDNLDRLRHR